MSLAIKVKNISKRYEISHESRFFYTLRDKLEHPIKAWRQSRMPKSEILIVDEVLAVGDVEFRTVMVSLN